MSDPTKGAKPVDAADVEADENAVVAEENEGGPTAVQKARKRLGKAGGIVTSKVSELRPTASVHDSDPVIDSATRGPVAATGSGATTSGAAATRRTRKARLRLARVDPWSVFKTALLFAVAGAIIFFIATWVVWGVINASGVFDSVNKAVNDLVSSPGSTSAFRLEDIVNTHRILGLTALIGAVDAVLFTALATLFSFLYNLAASVMGGLEVTLAED